MAFDLMKTRHMAIEISVNKQGKKKKGTPISEQKMQTGPYGKEFWIPN